MTSTTTLIPIAPAHNYVMSMKVNQTYTTINNTYYTPWSAQWQAYVAGVTFGGTVFNAQQSTAYAATYTFACNGTALSTAAGPWSFSVAFSAQDFLQCVPNPSTGIPSLTHVRRFIGNITVTTDHGNLTMTPAAGAAVQPYFKVGETGSATFSSAVTAFTIDGANALVEGADFLAETSDLQYMEEKWAESVDGTSASLTRTIYNAGTSPPTPNPNWTGTNTSAITNRVWQTSGSSRLGFYDSGGTVYFNQADTCYLITSINQQVTSRWYGSNAPIPNMPLTLQAPTGGLTLSGTTDANGLATVPMTTSGTSAISSQQFVVAGQTTGAFLKSIGMGDQDANIFADVAFDVGPVLQLNRTASTVIENGGGLANWRGVQDISSYVGCSSATTNANWVLSGSAGNGINALFPAASAASGHTYGLVMTPPNAGTRRAFRNYRFLKVRIYAATGTVAPTTLVTQLQLQIKAGYVWNLSNTITNYFNFPLTIQPGENVFDLDMSVGPDYSANASTGEDALATNYGDNRTSGQSWDQFGQWQVPDCHSVPSTFPSSVGSAYGVWTDYDVYYLGIVALTPGVQYTVELITAHDQTGSGQTPLRAISGYGGNSVNNKGIGVYANGRPVASMPFLWTDTISGVAQAVTPDIWASTFLTWIDEGENIWSSTSLNTSISSASHANYMSVDTVTETSITFRCKPRNYVNQGGTTFNILPGYNQTVSANLSILFEYGAVISGLLFNITRTYSITPDGTNATGSGHKVEAKISYTASSNPGSLPVPYTMQTAAADADGWFQFNGLVNALTGSSGSVTYIEPSIDCVDNPVAATTRQYYANDSTWTNIFVVSTLLLLQGGAVCVDSKRQWLHVGRGTAINTYQTTTGTLLFSSPAYAVSAWAKIKSDRRRGDLLMLAANSSAYVVYQSSDGGQTGNVVLTMTTSNALIVRDSARGSAYALYADSNKNVFFQASQDGGTTWAAAVAAMYSGAQLNGTLLDVCNDERRGSLELAITISSGTVVLESTDLCATWALKLS